MSFTVAWFEMASQFCTQGCATASAWKWKHLIRECILWELQVAVGAKFYRKKCIKFLHSSLAYGKNLNLCKKPSFRAKPPYFKGLVSSF